MQQISHQIKSLPGLLLILATAGITGSHAAQAANNNEEVTKQYLATLVSGAQPKQAELTMFFTMMPKGGDLHHHYSGAIYAEQYLDWVDSQHYCIYKTSYRIETNPGVISAERAETPDRRDCLSASEVIADNAMYRELLQRWSNKDFYNHSTMEPPPDQLFFDTFGYFGPVSSSNRQTGLQQLKQRAIQENLSYIETMLARTPDVQNADFDAKMQQANDGSGNGSEHMTAQMNAWTAVLEQDRDFTRKIDSYLAEVTAASTGIDDARFTMRYQAFVVRLMSPSQVFSSLLAAFKAADQSKLIVGVNIVGPENTDVAMRDYSMHMQMFKFLKTKYPQVKLALHAGELTLGMVPPEGLRFHIKEAIDVAGANRIGHGIDLAYETDAIGILKEMRERGIAVEINLSSNEFILGVKDEAHPVTLYRKYHVPFVLSTDDPGVSRDNLSGEYALFASRYKPDYTEVKKLSYDSLRYSFLAEADKKRLLKALDVRFAAFEAKIADFQKTAASRK